MDLIDAVVENGGGCLAEGLSEVPQDGWRSRKSLAQSGDETGASRSHAIST
jgi:hypothetical protein